MDHAKAFGRIAFSCPSSQLPTIEAKIKESNDTILTPLVSLDTPGKATVQVVILADPVGFFLKNVLLKINFVLKIRMRTKYASWVMKRFASCLVLIQLQMNC